jgi:hypothetical protein
LFLRNSNSLHVQGGAVDDGACGACSLDGYVEHGVEIGRHEFLRAKPEVLCAMSEANGAFSHEICPSAQTTVRFAHFEHLELGQ